MEFEEFIEEMKEKLQELLGSGYCLERQEILGINSVVKHSLAVSGREKMICPCVDMGQCYRAYQAGTGLDELAGWVLEACKKEFPVKKKDVSGFMEWDFIKRHIFARLINTGKNEALLAELPYRNYLDLSLVYYVRIKGEAEDGAIQIHREHMEHWGVDEETLYRQAWKNLHGTEDAVVENMGDILRMCCSIEDSWRMDGMPNEVYVLGSRNRAYGAVHMFSRETLHSASILIGGDFWILPSSIHEVILIPAGQEEDEARDLAGIVGEVNDTHVRQNEILSYHVYRYCKERGEVIIAA